MRNFMELKQGDLDPYLGRKIEVLIVRSAEYIVYLDEDLEVQWAADIVWPTHQGEVFNRISHLEGISDFLKGHRQFKAIRCMLGEGVARLLDGDNIKEITTILNNAERLILLRNREYSRKWFYVSSFLATGIMIILLSLLFYFKDYIDFVSDAGIVVIASSLLGSLGALASVILRSDNLSLDANAGFYLHVLDAIARISTGIIAAFVFSLLIKGGILLEAINTAHNSMFIILGLSVITGASERVLPGLITKGEDIILNSKFPSGAEDVSTRTKVLEKNIQN